MRDGKFLGSTMVLGLATAACAATYTATLPTGATNTLAEAFANAYVACDEGTPTMEGLYAASELQVNGGGRLEINVDLKSAGFAGAIRVKPGATLRITANGALGDTAHGTFVESGATLENECLDTSGDSKLAFSGEPLTFEGTGVDGVGALVARTRSKQERNGVWGGTVLTMTGDATIATVNGYQDFPNNSANNSLDMNGHTLTIRGITTANRTPSGVCLRPVITNPGHIVVETCGASINSSANLNGDAANTFTIGNNASLEMFSATLVGKKKWTLRVSAASLGWCFSSSQNGACWDGPIVYETGKMMNIHNQAAGGGITTNHTALAGAITAPGRLKFLNDYPSLGPPFLTLSSPDNDFQDGLVISNIALTVGCSGAVPAACTPFEVWNAPVSFADPAASYTMPVLCASGSVSVAAAKGSFAGVVKGGEGELFFEPGMTFPSLDLRGGTMRMSAVAPDFACFAGLHYGYSTNFGSWATQDRPPLANRVFYNPEDPSVTNKTVIGFEDLAAVKPQASKGSGTYYAGYIMNNTDANVTWRFASCCSTLAFLKINGAKVISRQGQNDVVFGNAVLHPGANSIDYRIASMGAQSIVASPQNNPYWTHGYGFAYSTSTTSTNSEDFAELADPGDGSVLRVAAPGSDYEHELAAAYTNSFPRTLERITAVNGTSLDIADGAWTVTRLEGPLAIVSTGVKTWSLDPEVKITGTLAADGADLVAGNRLSCGARLVFAPGAKIEVAGGRATLGKASTRVAVVAASTLPIEGEAPEVESDDGAVYRSVYSADRRTLSVEFIPPGTQVIFR